MWTVTWPRTGRPKNRGSTTGGGKKFFSSRNVLIGSEAHRASHLMVIGGNTQEIKGPERQAEHSPPSNAEVKNGRI
jgi:hypothetical protein